MRIEGITVSATARRTARSRFAEDLQTIARELETPRITCHLTIDDDGDLSCGNFELRQGEGNWWRIGFDGAPDDDRRFPTLAAAAMAATRLLDEDQQ